VWLPIIIALMALIPFLSFCWSKWKFILGLVVILVIVVGIFLLCRHLHQKKKEKEKETSKK